VDPAKEIVFSGGLVQLTSLGLDPDDPDGIRLVKFWLLGVISTGDLVS